MLGQSAGREAHSRSKGRGFRPAEGTVLIIQRQIHSFYLQYSSSVSSTKSWVRSDAHGDVGAF